MLEVRKNIKIFVYDNNNEKSDNIIELSQATLNCKKSDINKIINFLTEIKKEIENNKVEDGDLWHYRYYNDSWNEKESDLIVFIDESSND